MNISVIDYIGVVNDGISVLLSWNIDDKFYELIFWFNKKNEYSIYVTDDLLKRLGVDDIYKWDQLKNFIIYVNAVLPPKEKIYKEFNI